MFMVEYQDEYFKYLSDLRESGRMNMNGAPAMLRSVFGLNKKDAYEVFIKWTEWLQNGSK